MQVTTKGLVLREVKTGEADRILSLLTPSQGIVSAAAKGSLRPKSKLFSATGLFCYSEFTLFEGRTMYRVNEATPIELFFGLRESIEGISLAAYFAEMLQILSPTGAEAEKLLRLTLNSLHLLSHQKKDFSLIKAVYELRALSESGFRPDLVACEECGAYEGAHFRFEVHNGTLLCGRCAGEKGQEPNADAATLAALRHIVFSEDSKVFNFTLQGNSLLLLSRLAEQFMLCHLDYPPKSLTFLKTIL